MNIADLKRQLEESKETLRQLEEILDNIYPSHIPMYLKARGKDTIVMQPFTQLKNLELNGWKVVNEEEIRKILNL